MSLYSLRLITKTNTSLKLCLVRVRLKRCPLTIWCITDPFSMNRKLRVLFAGHKYSRYMNVMNSVYGMDTRGGGLFALFWRSLGEFETIGKTFTNMNLFGTFVYLFAYLHPAAPLALILRMPLNNKRKFSFCCCC